MVTITVKNIPDELYQRLKSVAESNRRSVNSEVLKCIEDAVYTRRIDPEEVIANARRLRELTSRYPVDDEELFRAKAEGRP